MSFRPAQRSGGRNFSLPRPGPRPGRPFQWCGRLLPVEPGDRGRL